jgi:hypothetical protein
MGRSHPRRPARAPLSAGRGEARQAQVQQAGAPATLHRKTRTEEHGIDLRLYEHYQQVQAITGNPVWLFVYEESKALILYARLDDLGLPRVYDGRKMNRSGMAFWPRDRFKTFAVLDKQRQN